MGRRHRNNHKDGKYFSELLAGTRRKGTTLARKGKKKSLDERLREWAVNEKLNKLPSSKFNKAKDK